MVKKSFIYIALIIAVGFIAYNTFMEINKKKVPGKLDRLPCHKNITSFERAYDSDKLNKAKGILLSGNYKLQSDKDKAQFMQSTLFDFISLEKIDKYFYNLIDSKTKNPRSYQDGITIDYTIFENDIEDPKKKSDQCKLYRGYIVLKIKDSNNKVLYQVQIDFMDYEGKDINKTLECTLESFLSY